MKVAVQDLRLGVTLNYFIKRSSSMVECFTILITTLFHRFLQAATK
jgi:hypothetical protein